LEKEDKIRLYSNVSKLRFWPDRIITIREKAQPIHLVVGLTTRCNLNCDFCWITEKEAMDLDFEDLKYFIQELPIKAIELSGGEPLLYPHINELIEYCYNMDISIGITTNGVLLKNLTQRSLQMLKWLRVSVNHFIEEKLEYDPPEIPDNVYYGFNYILYEREFDYKKLIAFKDKYNGEYIRVSLDRKCKPDIEKFFDFTSRVNKYQEKNGLYFRRKVDKQPYIGECFFGFLKVQLEPNGWVYNCLCHLENWGWNAPKITDIKHPHKLLEYPNGRIMRCKNCYYVNYNEYVLELLKTKDSEFL